MRTALHLLLSGLAMLLMIGGGGVIVFGIFTAFLDVFADGMTIIVVGTAIGLLGLGLSIAELRLE